jgi:hypothetical protein
MNVVKGRLLATIGVFAMLWSGGASATPESVAAGYEADSVAYCQQVLDPEDYYGAEY